MHNLDKIANYFRDELSETLAKLVDDHKVIVEQITIKSKGFQITFVDTNEDSKIKYELPIIKYKESK